MSRRRLVLTTSSEEDEDEEILLHQQQQHHENEVTLQQDTTANNNNQLLNPNPNPLEPLPVSDDEFIDVSDNLSSPSISPEPVSNLSSPQPPPVPSANSGCPIGDLLVRMGLHVNREWLNSCLQGLESSIRGLDVAAKAKLCFQQFLFSDMNFSGGGVLPPNVDSMHLVDLAGPFVLQVDEIVNLSCPLRGRYHDAPPGIKRCLKLSMTDGVQRVFGMEYRPIKDLQVLAPAGLKVVICNVHVRHGLLMLVPEALEVLGGMVDELEAARQLLVGEVNKPPRGKRSRTGVVPPLATRATQAAWPSNGVTVPGMTNNTTGALGRTNSSTSIPRSNGSVNVSSHTNNFVSLNRGTDNSVNLHEQINRSNVIQATSSSTIQVEAPFQTREQGSTSGNRSSERARVEFSVPMSLGNSSSNPLTTVVSNIEEMQIDASVDRGSAVSDQHSATILNNEDVFMVDEFEHPLILSGDRETPFTYFASLSAKWAAMKEKTFSVQGKVKCFLTGVKAFQYKQRTKYELAVYVDDGSLISEILIDHNLVQERVGHSPEEVTAALSSSDSKRVGDVKEALKQFQTFLLNFEGTIFVEMNRTYPLPVALEMNQGCSASDAWLLMKRLTSSAPAQTPQQPLFEPIDISP
ncbi:recQ-mediated genome instability protein 1 [Euphorbia lathyris]|uniref:recQ-mediated genome instability protein 1 n=1 Tax=Euphorbia lathyris TaxID=212925 RepID=UPI0033142CDC